MSDLKQAVERLSALKKRGATVGKVYAEFENGPAMRDQFENDTALLADAYLSQHAAPGDDGEELPLPSISASTEYEVRPSALEELLNARTLLKQARGIVDFEWGEDEPLVSEIAALLARTERFEKSQTETSSR